MNFWKGQRVFLTGHTGFKGGWLSLWLSRLGAKVHGYSLDPPTNPSLFVESGLRELLASHSIGNICNGTQLLAALRSAAPELVFHLAAQPLVKASYEIPVETYATNVIGTVNLLEAVREVETVRAVIIVTSDKCYENLDLSQIHREDDPLGGRDPYSSSKACAEIVTAAYRDSFLARRGIAVATVRAGNVIGGGDWAPNRLLPDFFRSLEANERLIVRHPEAIRPWQHVLEPLHGYLMLGEALITGGSELNGAWNFGPEAADCWTVKDLLDHLVSRIAHPGWRHVVDCQIQEARSLLLDNAKARLRLGWMPRWSLKTALDRTVEWHMARRTGAKARDLCMNDISSYELAD